MIHLDSLYLKMKSIIKFWKMFPIFLGVGNFEKIFEAPPSIEYPLAMLFVFSCFPFALIEKGILCTYNKHISDG